MFYRWLAYRTFRMQTMRNWEHSLGEKVQKSVQNCVISVQKSYFLTKFFRPPTGEGHSPSPEPLPRPLPFALLTIPPLFSRLRRHCSPVLSRFTSSSTSQPISLIIPDLVTHHSFTPGSKPIFSTNRSHFRLLLPTGLPWLGLDRTYHAHHFIFSFTFYVFFLFIPCGRQKIP